MKRQDDLGFRRACAALLLLLSALLFILAACGYLPVGTGSLPPGIRRIHVPLFANMTTRYELDLKMTQAVINEFVARGRIEITTDAAKADAVLSGRIQTFLVNPIAFSNQRAADRYDMIVVVEVALKESRTDKVLYSNPSFMFRKDYQVPQGSDFESSESEAITTLAQLFARQLIVAILEGF
jgi:outer membrane lipopolysaccharide assembly protein LptE/RlpB